MEYQKLNDPSQIKFLCIYAKDERFQTVFSKYVSEKLKTGNYAYREPNSQEELAEAVVFGSVAPLGYSRWVTSINADKVRINKSIADQMKDSDYSTNIIFTSNFKTMTILKKMLSFPQKNYEELTFATLNYDKIFLLQELLVPKQHRLESGVLSKILKGYRTRPEKVLDLFYQLKNESVTDYKDIVSLLGSPDNTIEKFLIKLLEVEIKSDRSMNTQIRNRYKEAEDLVLQIGYENVIPYFKHTVKDIMYIKQQYMAGVLYKSVARQGIEYKKDGEVYESERDITYIKRNLSKYIDSIKLLPLSKVITLYSVLNDTQNIRDNLDLYNFILKYLLQVVEYQSPSTFPPTQT